MHVFEREMKLSFLPKWPLSSGVLKRFVLNSLLSNEIPIRLVVASSNERNWHCELMVLKGSGGVIPIDSLFKFNHREIEDTSTFNTVLVVPTGIGAEIGGHAGDASPVARLLASACDTLITHPNVVNASDINELPENGLYVEGSVLTRLLMGTIGLQKVRSNRVLLVISDHEDTRISDLSINAASAARATLGLECHVLKVKTPIKMFSEYTESGKASGYVTNLKGLNNALIDYRYSYDVVALASVIDVPESYHLDYFQAQGKMINPWGGVEAMLTHTISSLFDVPSAHAPMVESQDILDLDVGTVDPRMAAEAVSLTFLHSVLKGLYRSPKIVACSSLIHPSILTAEKVSCLVVPDGCIGLPTLAALEQGIPVIAVKENRNCMDNNLWALPFEPEKLFMVDNYLEAVGVMEALKAGVSVSSVRRPLTSTTVNTFTMEERAKK